ncbi:MAG TPA: hypothetical protein EYQ50_10945 [Verrucomicrobiales bacterium]|nr:hypothetical protein [Verrucomicrobiales bacterium]
MAKVSQRQIVAKIDPSDADAVEAFSPGNNADGTAYFAQATGGEITAAVEKVYDGGQRFPEVLCATADVGDITLTRHYDKDRDSAFLAKIRHHIGNVFYTVTFSELNCDLESLSNMRQYNNALLVGLTEPDSDASSGAPASYSLTFSVGPITALS